MSGTPTDPVAMQHGADITPIPRRPPYAEMWKTVQTDRKTIHKNCALLARVTGLEPATSGVTGRRSNQLSYTRSGRGEQLGRCIGHVKREEDQSTSFRSGRCWLIRPKRASGNTGTGYGLSGNLVGGDGFEPPTLSV